MGERWFQYDVKHCLRDVLMNERVRSRKPTRRILKGLEKKEGLSAVTLCAFWCVY